MSGILIMVLGMVIFFNHEFSKFNKLLRSIVLDMEVKNGGGKKFPQDQQR